MEIDNHTSSHFTSISRWNKKVRALLDWDEQAATERAQTYGDGELAGWSVAVKDIIDVAGFPTRCNAPFTSPDPVSHDAAIVEALRCRGAFVIAKSVTTTFAYYDPGQTANPWHLDHTPGGSSSGSAAAIACGMARLALGSQTVGSVNRPASYCGVVGFKPTYGRLSTEGIFPLAPSVDTVGFFNASASDAQTVFSALTGEPALTCPRPLRIGLVSDLLCPPAEPAMSKAIDTVANALRRHGHKVWNIRLPVHFAGTYKNHHALVAAEAAQVHVGLFAQHRESYTENLRQLIEFGQQVTDHQLWKINTERQQTKGEMDTYFDTTDALLSPSAPGPAPRGLHATGDPRMNLLWTYCGLPTLTLPASLEAGLPLGVQLTGRAMGDAQLLAVGKTVEEILGFKAKPGFVR